MPCRREKTVKHYIIQAAMFAVFVVALLVVRTFQS